MSHTILITGVSGHLGSGVLDHLLKTVPADRLIALARDPKKVERYAAKGVTVRQGDFSDPSSMDQALSGVHTLLLIPTWEVGEARLRQHKNVVDAAKRAGVQHILYTGVVHHDEPGHGTIVSDHQDTEQYIAASGMPHTFIRNGIYLDVLPQLMGNAHESGTFAYPTPTKGLTLALRADLAEATANIIKNTALHGKPIELGSTKPVFFPEVAAALANTTGRPVQHVHVPLPDFSKALREHGLDGPTADVYTGMARAISEGVISTPNGRLAEILGREPVGVEAFLQTALKPVNA